VLENNSTNRQGEEHDQRGTRDNRANMIGIYIYTTPMPLLLNESKHNDNWIEGDCPKQNIEVLIVLMMFSVFKRVYLF
jgi:hypothetical protein